MAKTGRKAVKDKKVQVTFYVRKSTIQENGGMISARNKCIQYLEGEKIS